MVGGMNRSAEDDFKKLKQLLDRLSVDIEIDNGLKITLSSQTLKQVEMDVERSFNFIENSDDKVLYKKLLKELIVSSLELNSEWFYYQGYHDLVAFFIYQFTYIENERVQFKHCDKLKLLSYIVAFSKNYLKDFMTKDLNNAMIYLKFIPKILKKYNVYNYQIFKNKPFYGSIANVMTLFTHNTSLQNIPIKLKIITHLLEAKNITFVLVFYAKLVANFKTNIEEKILTDAETGNDPLVIQSLINTLITDELDIMKPELLDKLLDESITDMNTAKIQNIFKYSFENKGLLINFNFQTEKTILKNTLLVAVNLVMLRKMKPDITSPYTFAGTVLTINNIHRLISYYTQRKLK